MKNILWMAMATFAIMAVSCNRVDTELIGKMQAEITKAQELAKNLEAGEKTSDALLSKMLTAPDGLKGNATLGYPALYERVVAIKTKYQGMAAEATEKGSQLQGLMDSYADGKEKKEDIVRQFESMSATITSSTEQSKQIASMVDEASASYAKMSAEWEALPEAEKQAATQKAAKTDAAKIVPRDSDTQH